VLRRGWRRRGCTPGRPGPRELENLQDLVGDGVGAKCVLDVAPRVGTGDLRVGGVEGSVGNINTLRRLSGTGSPPDVICQTRVSGYAKEGGDIAALFGLSLLASTQTRRRGPYAGRSMPPWE